MHERPEHEEMKWSDFEAPHIAMIFGAVAIAVLLVLSAKVFLPPQEKLPACGDEAAKMASMMVEQHGKCWPPTTF